MRRRSKSRRLLPERDRGAAWISHDGELAGGPARALLKNPGTELRGPLRGAIDVIDLGVRDPAVAGAVFRGDAGERACLARKHAHAPRTFRALPTEEIFVEPRGLGGLLTAFVEPDERICHRRLLASAPGPSRPRAQEVAPFPASSWQDCGSAQAAEVIGRG